MDIYEFAMQMELDGRNFYLELAGKAKEQGLQSIMEMLAADEMKHYNILQDMKIKKPSMAKTKVLDDAKNVFKEMRFKGEDKRFPTSQIDLYKKPAYLFNLVESKINIKQPGLTPNDNTKTIYANLSIIPDAKKLLAPHIKKINHKIFNKLRELYKESHFINFEAFVKNILSVNYSEFYIRKSLNKLFDILKFPIDERVDITDIILNGFKNILKEKTLEIYICCFKLN